MASRILMFILSFGAMVSRILMFVWSFGGPTLFGWSLRVENCLTLIEAMPRSRCLTAVCYGAQHLQYGPQAQSDIHQASLHKDHIRLDSGLSGAFWGLTLGWGVWLGVVIGLYKSRI